METIVSSPLFMACRVSMETLKLINDFVGKEALSAMCLELCC